MTLSFRFRLFVAAALIVAASLGVVMAIGWSRMLDFEIHRLDSRLCMEARRLASQRFHGEDLNRLEADMRVKLRLAQREQLMLRFEPADGAAGSLQSSHWLPGLEIDRLQWTPAAEPGAAGSWRDQCIRLLTPGHTVGQFLSASSQTVTRC